MKRKNIEKIFKNSLTPELKDYFKLIRQTEKVQKNFNIKELVSYDILVSIFKNNLNDIQRGLFLELYNKPVEKTDFDVEEHAVSLYSSDDFKNEMIRAEIIENIYSALRKNDLSIMYTNGKGETKELIAMKFSDVEEKPKKKNDNNVDYIFIHDEGEDGQIKKLLIKRINSISILPF